MAGGHNKSELFGASPADGVFDEMVDLRREIHRQPELAFDEHLTTAMIRGHMAADHRGGEVLVEGEFGSRRNRASQVDHLVEDAVGGRRPNSSDLLCPPAIDEPPNPERSLALEQIAGDVRDLNPSVPA